MNQTIIHTKRGVDETAAEINDRLNDVRRAIEIGAMLDKVLRDRFGGDLKAFRRWARLCLDREGKTLERYLALYRMRDRVEQTGAIRLQDAYQLFGLDGLHVNLTPPCR